MLTHCPHCETAFRVTSGQLKARQGRVRCGACGGVFSALDRLSDEPQLIVSPLPEPEPESAATEPESIPEPESAPEPSLPDEWQIAKEVSPRRWPWTLGVLLLLVLGAGQLLYCFRVELAMMAPALRPALVDACDLAGCTVPHPGKPELASIESSDLAPAGADRLLLTATLKNRAPFDQEYPHLELTLTDTRDESLLRKVLAPADWLPPGHSAAAGFPARGEVAVKLLLEAPGVPAMGYRLYLFYP